MAKNTGFDDKLIINIEYDYDNSGVKQCAKDVEALANNSAKGFMHVDKIFKGLPDLYKKLVPSLEMGNEKVRKAVESYKRLTRIAENAQKTYAAATKDKRKNRGGDPAKADLRISKSYNAYANAVSRQQEAFVNILTTQAKVENDRNVEATREAERLAKERAQEEVKAAKEAERAEKEKAKETEKAQKEAEKAEKELIKQRQAEEKETQKLTEQIGKLENAYAKTVEAQKQASLKKINGFVEKLKKNVKQIDIMKLVAQLYAVRRAWKMVVSLVEASAEWVENLNLLEVVFGDAADSAKKFVKATSDNLGLDANELAQYAATFKQMANAMGQSAGTGTQLSKALTYLALDISSLRNVDVKTAMSDLASGIAGQVKPVRKYGADITEDSVNAFLKPYGMSSSSLSQADKQLVRALLLIRQLKDSWGDMAKTIDTFSNQQRVLNSQFETFKRLVGSILVGTFKFGDSFEEASKTAGIATKAIWYLNGALIAINEVLAEIAPQAESVNSNVGTAIDDLTDSFLDLEDAQKGSLLSFDKFNTLSGGGSKSGISGLLEQLFGEEAGDYIKQFEESMNNTSMYAKQIAVTFQKMVYPEFAKWLEENPDGKFSEWAKTTGSLKDKLDSLKNSLFGIITVVIGLKSPLAAIGLAVGKMALTDSNVMQRIVSLLVQMGNSVSDLLPKIVKLVETLAPLALKLLELSVGFLDSLNNSDLLVPALVALAGAFGGLKVIKTIAEFLKLFSTNAQLAALGLNAMYFGAGLFLGLRLLEFIGKFGPEAKRVASIIMALTGAVVGLAAAIMLAKGVAAPWLVPVMLAAAGTAVAGAIGYNSAIKELQAHADGGFQRGGAFIAGEKGPEWVGRQGGTSTILNDRQMDDIMTDSVARGVKLGMASSYGDISRANSGSTEAAVYLDGNKVGRYVAASAGFRGEANRRNTSLNWK